MDKKTNIHFRLSFQLNKEGIDEANARLVELFKTLNQANDASKSATKQWQEYAMGAAGITTALSGLNNAISSLTSSYLSFDSAMRRVNTMAGLGQQGFEEIKDSVDELAQSIPLAREQLADGLYQVISNGVPTDNWIDFLNASARSAVGGIADLGQTVTVTSTIIKNYVMGWESAQEIQDKMQLTAKNGVTSFEQLAASLPRVAGNAASLGVSLDELMASFATLTGVSGNTAEVSTQLAAIFTSLVKPSSEATKMAAAMGIQFNAAAIEAKGGFEAFLTFLQQTVSAYAASSGQLEQEIYGKLFGSAEALRALGALTGPLADKFRENISAMADSAGTMDQAFEEMGGTAEANMQLIKNSIASATDWAAQWLTQIQPFLSTVSSMAFVPQGFIVMAKAVKALGAAITATLAPAVKKLIPLFVSLTMQAKLAATAATGAARAIGLLKVAMKSLGIIGLILAAISAAVYAFNKLTDSSDESSQSIDRLKQSNDNIAQTVGRVRAEMDQEIAKLRALIDAKKDTSAAVDELNRKYGDELGRQQTAAQWLEILTKKSQTYARAKALEAESIRLATEEYELSEKKRINAEAQTELKKSGRDKVRRVTGNMTMGSIAGASMGAGNTVVEDTSKEMQALLDEAEQLTRDAEKNAADRKRVADMIVANNEELGAALSSTGKSGSGVDDKKKKKEIIPEGSLKAVEKKITDIRAKISLAVDDQSRIDLNAQLAALEKEKRTIEFCYKFPSLTKENLQAVADYIESTIPPLQLKLDQPQLPTTVGQDIKDNLDEVTNQDSQSALQQTVKGLNDIGGAMQSLSKITGEGAAAWLSYAGNVVNAVGQAIPALQTLFAANTATAGSSTLAQNASAGPWGWIAGIAAMASVLAAMASLPKFAEGGIAYGPTVGLFGEYPGAANNPEVVAPLSKLESIIEPRGFDPKTFRFVLRGRTLVAAEEKEARYISKR